MTTVNDVIRDALRDLGVVPTTREAAADEADIGLRHFNNMMHGLKAKGGDTGFATLELTDEVPVEPEHVQSVTAVLMRWLALPYQVQLTPNQAVAAQDGERTLQAAYSQVSVLEMDPGLRNRTHAYHYDIEQG